MRVNHTRDRIHAYLYVMPTFNEIKKQRSNFTQCMHLPLFLPIVSDSLDNTHSPQYVQACVEFSLARWVGSEQVAACAALKRRRNGKKMERRKENQWDIFASHWQKMIHPSFIFFGRDDCELHYAFSSLSPLVLLLFLEQERIPTVSPK